MRPARTIAIVVSVLLAVAPAAAQGPTPATESFDSYGDVISVFSGDIQIPANTRQHGTVVCIGGNALIEGEVIGDVVVILGSLDNRGTVHRAVTGVLAEQRHRNARVGRELVSVLGSVELENTRVSRELVNILGGLKRDASSSPATVNIGFGSWFPDLWSIVFWLRLLRLFSVFVLLLLLVALVPDRVRVIGEEAPVRYATAFFVGLLGYLAWLVLVGLLCLTVIGLPLAILAFAVLKWLGIAGIFYAVGRRVGRVLNREMSLLGAVMLAFGLYVVLTMAPSPLGLFGLPVSLLLGSVFFVVIQIPAVGLVLMTRAGGGTGDRRPRSPSGTPAPRPTPGPAPSPPPQGPIV